MTAKLRKVAQAAGFVVLFASLAFGGRAADAPYLSSIPDQGVFPNASSRPIAFVIGDDATPAANLVVTGYCSDLALLRPSGLVFSGSGSNRSLAIIPASGLTGTATVSVVVRDTEGLSTTNTFGLDVNFFTPLASGLPAMLDAKGAWADTDNDGLPDAILGGYAGFDLPVERVYRNLGHNTFADVNAGLTAQDRNQTFWGDFDRDGFLDVVISGSTNTLYRNQADGTFTNLAGVLPRFFNGSAAWGDYDNDGDLDVVTAGSDVDGTTTRLMRNNGDGTFTEVPANLPPMYGGSVDWGDYDNDSDLDLLMTGYYGTMMTKLLRNDGNDAFTEVPIGAIVIYYGSAHWGDYDNDGYLDILLSGGNGDINPVSRIYHNNRNGTFSDVNAGLQGVALSSSAWGDFDNDGYLDVVVSGQSTNGSFTGLYRNNRNQTFSPVNAGLTNVQFGSAAWADSDRDGDLDLLLVGYGGNWNNATTQLYRNNAPSNTPSSAPGKLATTISTNGAVIFTWSRPFDAETPGTGLDYALRVGTTPGGIEIMTPQADLVTGQRRLTQGTGMHTNRWRLRDLPKGNYYWSVQAVDTSFAGSPFAAERSFTITNTPPTVSAAAEVRTGPLLAGSVPFAVGDAESAAGQISVTAQSLDGTFIPPGGVSVQGTGAARTLNFQVSAGQIGTNYIVLRATDPDGLTTDTRVRVVSEWFTSISFPDSTNFSGLSELRMGPGYPYGNPVVDLDGDGDLDVLMQGSIWMTNGGYYLPVVVVASNNGPGSFTFNYTSNFLSSIYNVWLDDFNRDGKVDMLADGYPYGSGSQLFAGNGQGGFLPGQSIANSSIQFFADLDNDGDLDGLGFITSPLTGGSTGIAYYRNNGGQLRRLNGPPFMSFTTYQETGPARATDIDNDGDVDFFIPGEGTNASQRLVVRVLRNPGRGPFPQEYYTVLGSASIYGINADDADDDFDLDMTFSYSTSYSGPIVRGYAANDGLGHFYFGDTNNMVPSSLGWDLDNDGDIDRVVSELVSTVPTTKYVNRLYLKTGPNQYNPQPFTMTQPQFVGDFDGDGDLDYMQRSEEFDQWGRVVSPMQWRLFRNNTDHTNRPPAAPTGLATVQQSDDRVRFTWNAAVDDHTPSGALTYNLRVGTTPGGVDIVAPCSDTVTGKRWLVSEGNAGRMQFHDLYSLPPGTYYWSVQAIDGVFTAGSWAPEKAFTINRPTISAVADIVTPPGIPSKPIAFTVTGGASPVNALQISAVADDPTLIANDGLVISGSGAQRTLTITPVGRSGDTDITLTATDQAGFSGIIRFHVRVAWWDPVPVAQVGIQRFEKWYFLDADLDGWMDFFGYTPQGTSAPLLASFQNQRDASFLLVTNNNLPYSSSYPLELGGFNNDNVGDVLTLQYPSYNTFLFQIWQGNGTGFDFTPLTEVSNRAWVTSHKWVDIDNDGCRDLIHLGSISTNGSGLLLAHGNRDGTFSYYPNRIAIYSGAALAIADFDLDGDIDIVVSGVDYAANGRDAGTNFNRLYLNQGNGVFLPSAAGLPQTNSWKFSVADADGDGRPDVLMLPTASSTIQAPRLMRNVGGTFVEVPCGLPPQLDLISWGDFDNDGDPDLVATYSSDYPSGAEGPYLATLFRNDGGVLNRADTGLPWILAHFADFADLDNDGDLDLLFSGETGWNQTGRFLGRNSCTRSNTPPPAPTGLSIGWGGESATLQWTPAPDPESGTALTYNVRIGTTPGGSEVMSAAADPATGQRRLTGIGNIGYAPRFRLVPPDGTYYWSVQAVDAGYAASPFSPEASFTYYHPTVTTFTNVLLYVGGGPVVQSFTVGDTDSDPSTLTLSAISTNTALLPLTNIVFGGSGSNRTVSVLPTFGAAGTSYVSVVVSDLDGLRATNSFTLVVAYFADAALNLPDGPSATPSFADFDNDGDLDVYLGGKIYRNDGSTNFTLVATVAAGQRHGVAWGDFDRDGDLDLAVAGWGGPTKIYRNDGGGVFADTGAVIPDAGNAAIAWGDFDNDGDLDLVFLATGQIYRNDGPQGFVPANVGLPAVATSGVVWGDFDNDGDLDLAISGFNGPSFFLSYIFRNDGGRFTDIGAGLYGLRGASAAWGDYDNDGYLDLLLAGDNDYAYQVRLYHNNGNGTFTEVILGLPGVAYGTAQWVDVNNDGYLDIFLAGAISAYPNLAYATRLYRNERNGTFTDMQASLPACSVGAWGDLDADGDLDVLLSGYGMPAYSFYRNLFPVPNSTPNAPTDLSATLLSDNNVLLSWSPGSDLENTNPASLSYVLRAGTVPGGVDLISPDAAANGYRRFPARGPLNTTTWLLRDVPRGTYYWSAQTIDAGFAGSAFAPEGTFTITNARPLISTVANQLTVPGRALPPLPFTVSDFETPASNLLVTTWSPMTNLVAPAGLLLGGTGTNRTVTVQPSPNQAGTATIVLSVSDAGGLVATSRFDVVIEMFTNAAAGLPGSSSQATASAWGDYDSDGDLDVALAGSGFSYTTICRNYSGNFSNQNFTLPNRTDCDLAWLDYDRDGDLDLMEAGWNGGYAPVTYFFRNNGTNTFTSVTISGLTNVADGTMSWADYDNDGDADLLLSGDPNTYHTPDSFTRLYRRDGSVFTNANVNLPQLVKSASAWADIDNDGDLDLLLAGQTGTTPSTAVIAVFCNDGNGVFTEVPTSLPAITQCAVAFGDYDNDGDRDILLAGIGTTSNLVTRIYRNDGDFVFSNSGATLAGVYQAAAAWGDYDNDGFLDALVSGTTNGYFFGSITRVYHNNGNGTFTALSATLPAISAQSGSWGDFDNDGDLDLLLGSQVYRNNWNIPNTPPTAPTNLLTQIVSATEVRFSWSAATDLQTTNSRGLNYNLRVGTSPGGTQIVAPQSDPVTGYRRVPLPGNAGATNFWRFSGLTNGTYYWSVQAIDPSFAGSPFAIENTLVISRPVISALTNRSTPPNSVVGPIFFAVSDAETVASNLVVTVSSSDTNVVPLTGLIVSGNSANRSLTVTPAAGRSGVVMITILATDESGQTGSSSFVLTVERFVDIGVQLLPYAAPVAWGDYDGDGYLDLLQRNFIFRNNGAGGFALAVTASGPVEGSSNWGDYDNDGDQDLLVTGSNASRIMRNNGGGAFADIAAGLAAPSTFGASAWGDFDNDGDLDAVVAGGSSSRIYRNQTNTSFADIGAGLSSLGNGSVAWGDYDKDGDLDLLMAGANTLRIYRNNGNGTFTDIQAGFPGVYYASAAWGDFDNNGKLDFAVIGSTNNAPSGVVTRIYRNSSNATASVIFTNIYATASQGPIGAWKGAVAWGDYDSDGDLDLLITGESTNAAALSRLFRNDSGNFVDSGWSLPAQKGSFAAWGDFDNDGWLDLSLSGYLSTGLQVAYIYRNFGSAGPSNRPPTAPSGLASVVTGKAARLSWSPAADPNQANALTYNLRIGTAPGLGDVLNPMAAADGTRRLPAMGNTQYRQAWTVTNLLGGRYYWSVQAVDHAFAGSAFAAEGTFTITNRPPTAIDRWFTCSEDGYIIIALSGSDPDNDPLTTIILTQPLFGSASGTYPNITYQPRANYFGFDQFTYMVSDRTTNSQPATVFMTVTPVQDLPAPSLGVQLLALGQAQLALQAEPWRTWQILVSEDLSHWRPWTNLLATNLLTQIIDWDTTNVPQRFYRAAETVIYPVLGSPQPGSNTFRFVVEGEPGRNYQVQVSSNLSAWTPLQHILMTNSIVLWADPGAGNFPVGFYRVRAVP